MEQATSISPTSKVKDLRKLYGYFKGYEEHGNNTLLYENISSCTDLLKKYFKFIGKVIKKKFDCDEVLYEDLNILWKSANVIQTASANYTSALDVDDDYEKVDEFVDLLISKTPKAYEEIGDAYCPFDTKYLSEISKYVEIGKILCETDCIKNIKKEIDKLKHNETKPSSYAAIVAPSFTGKTQTAFTLSHLMDVFYINIASAKKSREDFQDIYSAFDKISTLFSYCVSKDMSEHNLSFKAYNSATNLHNNDDNLEASDLSYPSEEKRYRVLGLILLLSRWKKLLKLEDPVEWLHRYSQVNRAVIPKLSVLEFKQHCGGKKTRLFNFLIIFIFRICY